MNFQPSGRVKNKFPGFRNKEIPAFQSIGTNTTHLFLKALYFTNQSTGPKFNIWRQLSPANWFRTNPDEGLLHLVC